MLVEEESTCCSPPSIETILSSLKMQNTQLNTIIKIKNLIIGNNKYKAFYLSSDVLIETFINLLAHTTEEDDKEILNQLILLFASFSLGNIASVHKLITRHNIHSLLLSLLHSLKSMRLLEACMRCLANLYFSAQLFASLIFTLDKQVYKHIDFMLKTLFPCTQVTKQTCITIFSISCTFTTSSLAACNRLPSPPVRLFEQLKQHRAALLSANCIGKFATLLTSLQESMQLHALKFYASICFECEKDAAENILSQQYYECSLLDLISAYLSRENSAELQLYAAKCLTNLCRSISVAEQPKQTIHVYKKQHIVTIKTRNDTDDDDDEDEEDDLIDEDTNSDLINDEYNDEEMNACVVKKSGSSETAFGKSNPKAQCDYSSSLVKQKLLPTLIRLCSTYSVVYHRASANKTSRRKGIDDEETFTKLELSTDAFCELFLLIESINTLTYLIEVSAELQSIAGYLEQIIPTLGANVLDAYSILSINKLRYNQESPKDCLKKKLLNANGFIGSRSESYSFYSLFYLNYTQYTERGIHCKQNEYQCRNQSSIYLSRLSQTCHKRLASVCFHALASLAANNEEARRQISENSSLVTRLIDSIQICNSENNFGQADAEFLSNHEKDEDEEFLEELEENFDDLNRTDADLLRLSGLCLLHSLSRSVHQLRTKFLDKKIWMPIIELVKRGRQRREEGSTKITDGEIDMSNIEADCELSLSEQNLIAITTALLANLLIEFSPSKETMVNSGIVKILVDLVDHKNNSIRLNCMWSLMNAAFQASQKTKQLIFSTITMEKLFQLLTEQDDTIIMKTLGLIRNLISNRPDIDEIMNTYGTKIIQAIIMILESENYNKNIKEQALCILSNVADGRTSKEFIMGNEDLLRKINSFMTHNCVELQISAVQCISNLVWSSDEGSSERQVKLKEMGAHRILQKLLQSNDLTLFDKVKLTLQQFASNNSTTKSSSATTLH